MNICKINTISKLVPFQLIDEKNIQNISLIEKNEYSIDSFNLSFFFWKDLLSEEKIELFLEKEKKMVDSLESRVQLDLDLLAYKELPVAKSIIGSRLKIPDAKDLLFASRVLARILEINTRQHSYFVPHIGLGIIAKEIDQYSLADIFNLANSPKDYKICNFFEDLLQEKIKVINYDLFVIGIRNDGELFQVFLLSALIKKQNQKAIIILYTLDANEQLNFSGWIPLFIKERLKISNWIDFFIPKIDYDITINRLIANIQSEKKIYLPAFPNLFAFNSDLVIKNNEAGYVENSANTELKSAFLSFVSDTDFFWSNGLKTILTRLLHTKCSWSGCYFCTINSQHITSKTTILSDIEIAEYVKHLLFVIKKNKIESLILNDENVPPNILLTFANSIIKENLNIIYRVRTKFSNEFTLEKCALLYKSGCRYLGIGLEAKSERINRMFNKRLEKKIDYEKILTNLDKVNIRVHVYSILGFPNETKGEINSTKKFLIKCISKFKNFSATPNLFYLMKGSEIEKKPEKFNVQIKDTADLHLVINFYEPYHDKNRSFAEKSVRKILQEQFLPHADDPFFADYFWLFVDQTGIFYSQKVFFEKSPYRELFEKCKIERKKIRSTLFVKSWLFVIETAKDDKSWVLCDWVTNNYVKLPYYIQNLILNYNSEETALENIKILVPETEQSRALKDFIKLVRHGFFIANNDV